MAAGISNASKKRWESLVRFSRGPNGRPNLPIGARLGPTTIRGRAATRRAALLQQGQGNNNMGLTRLFNENTHQWVPPPAVPPVSVNTKKIVNKLVTILKSKSVTGKVPVANTPEARALLEAATKKNVQNTTVTRLISILKSKIKPPTFTQSNNAHGVIKDEKGRVIGSVFLNQNGNPGFKVKGVFKTEYNGWSLNKVSNTSPTFGPG